MSFLGGPECSTAANPLAQFTKHVQDDKTLQRDRLVGRGPAGLQEGMRNQVMGMSADGMMGEFMQQSAQMSQGPHPFAMEHMRRELEHAAQAQRTGSPAWATEFDPGLQGVAEFHTVNSPGFNPAEFARFQMSPVNGSTRTANPSAHTPAHLNSFSKPLGMGMGYSGIGVGMMGMNKPYSSMSFQQPSTQASEGKGKSRMVELDEKDWEAQFAALEQTDEQVLDAEANEAIERELNDIDRLVPSEEQLSETDHFGDFESVWRGIQAETANARALADNEAFAESMHVGDISAWERFDGLHTHGSFRDPEMGEYLFEQENLFTEVADPFTEGVRIMEEGGNLSLAALAFEAAVQKNPQHIEAWTKLGAAQAQNEKESPAIRALEQALKLDSVNLEALMGLAVSYTNEGYDSTAYRTLERWLATKYPSLTEGPLSDVDEIGFTDRQVLHDKVTNLFIQAAQLSPSGEQMDPDVQVGLGVLFYGAEEYDKAVDCFGAALASTESGTTNQSSQLHLLWNRLGATLANSGRSEEAIDAYERALALRPNFVRARYNLGVSCINIGCYNEAAQHLLGALAMHKVVEKEGREKAKDILGGAGGAVSDGELDRQLQQNYSTNLFDTLRRVFGQMGRRDLADMVGPGMDVESLRRDFEF